MAFLARENIAMPEAVKGQLIYKWPDLEIRKFSNCIVEGDYSALFTLQGEIKGVIDQPGRYPLEATELPFLGIFIDAFTGGNRFRSELYYISKRELLNKFGGPIDNVRDPISGIPCKLFVYGENLVKIADAQKLIYKYSGTQNIPDNSMITDLSNDFLLTSLKQAVVQKIARKEWEVYSLSAYTKDIQATTIEDANAQMGDYGLLITRMPTFNITLDDDSQAKLDKWYERQSMVTLAAQSGANYERAAAAEVQFGAGQGFAQGGGNSAAFLGAGIGLGQQVLQPPPPPPPATAPAGPAALPGTPCPSCGTANPTGAKFCASCGSSMAPPQARCPSCGVENAPAAKFCSSCGGAMAAAPAAAPAPPATLTCAGCGTQLAPGAKFCPSCGRATGQ